MTPVATVRTCLLQWLNTRRWGNKHTTGGQQTQFFMLYTRKFVNQKCTLCSNLLCITILGPVIAVGCLSETADGFRICIAVRVAGATLTHH